MSWLPEAVAEVAERQQAGRADPPTAETHPYSIAQGLRELLDQRDPQQEAADPAA